MKIQHKSVKMALLLGIAAWTLTSCQDWLTIYPQTQVVEENFWEDKNDLEGVRYAAYTQMCNTLGKIVTWGDLRSDSYDLSNAFQSGGDDDVQAVHDLYKDIREGRIERDSANTYFDWSGFYTTINYCNKVLYHGPEVLANDKQFTRSEWLQIKAEVTALRALNYFYLIRAFKDVPYTTKVINKDTEIEYFGATNQLVVLDSLIADVENIKGQARNRFSSSKDTKGLITNAAIYALLSDMYLWRASLHEGRGITNDDVVINNVPEKLGTTVAHTVEGDYNLCIKYADEALAALAEQTRNGRIGMGLGFNQDETLDYGLENCNMIKNDFRGFANGTPPSLTAFHQIFSYGNSDESIFELQFSSSEQRKNEVINGALWGYANKTHLAASYGALGAIYDDGEQTRDSRTWFSAWSNVLGSSTGLPGLFCFKWGGSLSIGVPESHQTQDITILYGTTSYNNWIIYRMSDVMLQKAEALAALNNSEAMRYVNAIHRRWYCNDDKNSTAQPSETVMDANGLAYYDKSKEGTLGNITKTESYEVAVLNERQIEFLGEGKRWFDLVRYAERHAGGQDGTQDPREWTTENPIGNGKAGVDLMADKFLANHYSSNPTYETLKHRFKNRYGLYNLIYYKEIKASDGKLEQNPVWNKHTYEE